MEGDAESKDGEEEAGQPSGSLAASRPCTHAPQRKAKHPLDEGGDEGDHGNGEGEASDEEETAAEKAPAEKSGGDAPATNPQKSNQNEKEHRKDLLLYKT